jgi:KUP system potassium uptake protein
MVNGRNLPLVRRLSVMAFWTWAKALEDTFDGANRRNLRRFIVPRDENQANSSAVDLNVLRGGNHLAVEQQSTVSSETDYYYMAGKHADDEKEEREERKELVRIDTCAVFYKLSAGTGVPHSFVGFIRQWPALPRVVVSALFILMRSFS